MSYKDILKIIPVVQSAQLVGTSLVFAKKKKKKARGFVTNATGVIVGSSLIQAESNLI